MRCRCEGEGFQFNEYIVDISYGGAGIVETKKFPTQGSELLVTILLPRNVIELPSRVVWVKSEPEKRGLADFGVEFLDSLPVRQEKLPEFFPRPSTTDG